MIDLHCHILPGVDDGPDTLEQALELARIAVADGTTHVVATPHIHPGRWNNCRDSILGHVVAYQGELARHGISLQVGFSGEVRLSDNVIGLVAKGDIPFYGEVEGYRIMLLEFPHGHIIPGSEKLVAWLLKRGIRPLIAHPERNKQIMKEPASLLPFIELGCWLQVTAGAVTGGFGERAQAVAELLLQDDLVTVIASDGHNNRARPPKLRQCYQRVAASYGEARAQQLMVERPAAIAASQFTSTLAAAV
ncbi:MAG: tyrosine-protein phosphatase [Parahaliea sp.]